MVVVGLYQTPLTMMNSMTTVMKILMTTIVIVFLAMIVTMIPQKRWITYMTKLVFVIFRLAGKQDSTINRNGGITSITTRVLLIGSGRLCKRKISR